MENTELDKHLDKAVTDRIQEARDRIAKRKADLSNLKSGTEHSDSSVVARLKQIKDRPIEKLEGKDEKNNKAKLGIADLAKEFNKNNKKMKDIGLAAPTPAQREDDKKAKEQEKKREQKREEAKKQQAEKLKKFENISLPDGLTIKQEAGQWMLYNKDNKSVKITSEVESIVKQNDRINDANDKIDKQNDINASPDIPTDNKAISDDDKVNIVSAVLSNDNVKSEMFKDLAPEVSDQAIKEISKDVIDYAETQRLYDMLQDPKQADKALKELEDKDKKNNNRPQKEMLTIPKDRGGR